MDACVRTEIAVNLVHRREHRADALLPHGFLYRIGGVGGVGRARILARVRLRARARAGAGVAAGARIGSGPGSGSGSTHPRILIVQRKYSLHNLRHFERAKQGRVVEGDGSLLAWGDGWVV